MITPHWMPLTIRRNDNPWRHRVNITDTDGQPLDMTGYHGRMQIRLYEGQPHDPIAALSKVDLAGFSDGSTFSDGTVFETKDSGNGSRIAFDDHGFEIAITQLDLLKFPFGGPDLPVIKFSYDILICKVASPDHPWTADDPTFDQNAWFEGTVDFHNGVTDPRWEPAPCPSTVTIEDGQVNVTPQCQHGIAGACAQYSPMGCLWFSMPTNVPTDVLLKAIWPDAA
jgi:hypothetical protein